jgi:hypothetical protein
VEAGNIRPLGCDEMAWHPRGSPPECRRARTHIEALLSAKRKWALTAEWLRGVMDCSQ